MPVVVTQSMTEMQPCWYLGILEGLLKLLLLVLQRLAALLSERLLLLQ